MQTTQGGTFWSFEQRGSVGIWTIEDWERLFEGEIREAERHYEETTNRADVESAVVAFDEVGTLGAEMQAHITDAWSELAQVAGVDRTAYVADGIAAMAVKSNVEAPSQEIASFDALAAAIEWAESA